MATSQELLTAVEAAIQARLAGEAVNQVGVGGDTLSFQEMSLEELREFRKELKAEVSSEAGTQIAYFSAD